MEQNKSERNVWWGTYSLENERIGRWRIGSSVVWLVRSSVDWRVAFDQGSDPIDDTLEVEVPYSGSDSPWLATEEASTLEYNRFSFQRTDPSVFFTPQLADRAIVVRPESPLYIPAGEKASLFISTPLWIRIAVGKNSTVLLELPLTRPSDTWFGPNTMEGELCYNTRTKARMQLEELPLRNHRAVTALRIRNGAEEPLLLERFRLPVEHLSLYVSPNGYLYTEKLTLELVKGNEYANVRIGDGEPKEIAGAKRVTAPREPLKTNLITRPFTMLFHKIREA